LAFGTLPIEDSWSTFKHKIQEIETRFVPKKSVHLGKPKPMWLSHKALKAVKHRHKVHRKYKDYKNKNWLQFLFIVKAAILKQQISKFYPQKLAITFISVSGLS